MSKFFSIPGFQHNSARSHGGFMRGVNPNFSQYYENHAEHAGKATGLEAGERVTIDGEPGIIHHEEYDQHTGKVHTIVQRSDALGSGTREVTWSTKDPKQMIIERIRRITS